MPKYTQQIVVFLDILGFSNMLSTFENEALENNNNANPEYHESIKLNELIHIFDEVVSYIKKVEFNYFLFSDNVCFSISYIENETEYPKAFEEVILAIGELKYKFAKEGYFLRGGIDAGWFLDNNVIAVGVPLARAYYLESKKAIHPRIAVSDNFMNLIRDYLKTNKLTDYGAFLSENYIKKDNDLSYLNPFFYITNYEDKDSKIEYLETYSQAINNKLNMFSNDKKIGAKFRWFANEFNIFIDTYTTNQAYLELDDDQLEYTAEDIARIKNLKIKKEWTTNIFPFYGLVNKNWMYLKNLISKIR